ncbi:2Fe-2S iron-sulfur cluster-binding protein [Pseudoalteromonas xiamenensis]|uniref:2Fe-2S iron-sulfur cluster binding domain-containing protein n=1 Tax=Pseudoalteromonas xiamenensis TaxID=882626 RepID=A0A975HNZ5_9GAMM|nr:2Fe-2S iron-sulfur cluster-binding protein [Pseudoalteromonas xiamenensis]QTH72730.1 2Fe-2S iron-sulfur cluster binding domain-containing protein [Pseudoalteromonas xiamenensis]WMN61380.1 2Fe-2S iron-sulfur cluster-binding protein [Pseudoalteromonas xiamenensis]
MPNIIVTDTEGQRSEVPIAVGEILMEVLNENDFEEIEGVCGGIRSCATCHVYVKEGWLDKLSDKHEEELELLSGLSTQQTNSRLSCQIQMTDALDGLELTIAPFED